MTTIPPESVPVQLTRIEGVINLVLQRMDDLVPRVERHEADLSALKSTTQRLTLEAKARDDTAVALAKALKEAKEASEAADRAKSAEKASEESKHWSPIQRLALVAALALALMQVLQAIPVR